MLCSTITLLQSQFYVVNSICYLNILHIEFIFISDALAGSIKLAAVLYAMGKYEDCLKLLIEKERDLCPDLITIGICGRKRADFTHTVLINERLVSKIIENEMTSSDVLRNNACACVIFLPSELPIIPKELQYELFRSFSSDVRLLLFTF